MFVVSAAIGEMIIPLIVGKVFDYVGSVSFLAEGCILCFAAFGAYLAVLLIGKGTATHGRIREGKKFVVSMHLAQSAYWGHSQVPERIGHFRVALNLIVKARLSAKL